MKKIALAITGASGSIYAKLLLHKLEQIKEQITELSLVITDNAKQVWQTELGGDNYNNFPARYFSTKDFTAPFFFPDESFPSFVHEQGLVVVSIT